jgi:hypothetical protein
MKQIERRGLKVDYALKWFLVISIILICIVVLFISAQRRRNIGFYNYDIMNRNANILVDESKSAFSTIIQDLKEQNISVASTGLVDIGTLEINKYVIDTFKDNIKGFSADSYVLIQNVDGTGLRNKLVEIIEAHDKCNALLFGSNIDMPFPLYEMSIYVFMITMVIICAMVLTFKMKPFSHLNKLQLYNRIKSNMKRHKHIHPREIDGICDDLDNLNADTDLIVKVLTVIMVPIATLLFVSQLLQSTSSLNTALYGSNLYRSNTCYMI